MKKRVRPKHYGRWRTMIARCYNKNFSKYKYYGARRIRICKAWRYDFAAFQAWCFKTHEEGKTLDRKNNSGPYSPNNCKWSTPSEQQKNRRVTPELKAQRLQAALKMNQARRKNARNSQELR